MVEDGGEDIEILDDSAPKDSPETLTATKANTTKKKKDASEIILLEKVVDVMEAAGRRAIPKSRDSDDIFGEYVAEELRGIQDVQLKKRIKYQIQSLLYSAQMPTMPSPGCFPPYQSPMPMGLPESPTTGCYSSRTSTPFDDHSPTNNS